MGCFLMNVKANEGNDNKYIDPHTFSGTQQIVYKRDSNGQLILDEKGHPIVDRIIQGEPFAPGKVEYFTE